MDPNDFLKSATPDLAKGGRSLAPASPFTSIVRRMLGPGADEVAEMWRDQVRAYRYSRQLRLLEKAEKMAQDAELTPQAVPPKILFPLLEGASFEDNEDLHTMWAALLANAASAQESNQVRPSFVPLLRQLSADEARLLNWFYDEFVAGLHERILDDPDGDPFSVVFHEVDIVGGYAGLGFQGITSDASLALHVCLDSLQSAQLIRRRFDVTEFRHNDAIYSLTALGFEFVGVCRPPTVKF